MTAFGVLRDATLTLDGTDYVGKVASVLFEPDTSVSTYRTLTPSSVLQDVDSPAWTCKIKGVQDWSTGGLAKLLNTKHGQAITAVFAPKAGTGQPQITATLMGMSVPFGGDQGAWAETEVTLPVVGQPTIGTVP